MPSEPDVPNALTSDKLELMSALVHGSANTDWVSSLLRKEPAWTRQQAISMLAAEWGYLIVDEKELLAYEPLFTIVPYAKMVERCTVVANDADGFLIAIIGTPFSGQTSQWIAQLDIRIGKLAICDPLALASHLDKLESSFSAIADIAVPDSDAALIGQITEISLASIQSESSTAVRLVNSMIFDALKSEASDIHIESLPQGMTVKFRIDGVLSQIETYPNIALCEEVIARIKVLAELDIAEKRVPQDGRFRVRTRGREIDIRVSIMPSIHGEGSVLRVLDKKTLIDNLQMLTLDSLGFDDQLVFQIRRLSVEPYGMLLVTGPTGSGKTTTLYAALTEINNGEDKIITIEDPVEYQLPGVLQIPVNERKGLTFSVGLRSILRHDPDKILVGEIRDSETAQIAVQSALTGHMVFTSVHANNAFDVIGRFIHMGVDPYNFVSSLTGIVAQRLIRQICAACSEPVQISAILLTESGIFDTSGFDFRIGKGCMVCRNTGYRGRRAIAEILRLTDEMRELIIARASIRSMKDLARTQGTRYLREVAIDMVRHGQTTLAEANRVTFVA